MMVDEKKDLADQMKTNREKSIHSQVLQGLVGVERYSEARLCEVDSKSKGIRRWERTKSENK